jgi:secretion/DNA translocation related TadE-like protein
MRLAIPVARCHGLRRHGFPGRRAARGVGTVLTAVIMVLVVLGTLAGVWALGWWRAHARAADAADLAAVAAGQAYAATGEGCSRARDTMARNGAALISCSVAGDATSFVVTVTAESPLWPPVRIPGAPHSVRVTALAGSSNAMP